MIANIQNQYNTEKYSELYKKYLRGDSAAEGELRSLSTSNDGGGAAVVPDELYHTIIQKQCDASVLRSLATVVPMAGNTRSIAVEAFGAGEEIDEGEDVTVYSAPLFEKAKVTFKKFICRLPVSAEEVEDGMPRLEEHIATAAGHALARIEEKAHFGPKAGFVAGITSEYVAQASASTLQYDDIINSYAYVKGCYAKNAAWVMSNEMLRGILMQTVRTGPKVVLAETNPIRLMGIPVYVSEYMSAYKTTDLAAVYGDFSFVLLGVARDIKVSVDPYTNAANDEIVYTVSMRTSATVTNTDALARIVLKP